MGNDSNSSRGSKDQSKHGLNKIGSIFKFGHNKDNNDNGAYQQKQRQKVKKSKTMKKQPTLLRKKTLKKIESAADLKINSMLDKLEKADVEFEILEKFTAYLKEERFDTESMNDDVMGCEEEGSNIINFINDARFSKNLADCIEDQNSMSFNSLQMSQL